VQPSALTLSGVAVIGGTATATGTANFKVQVSNSFATPKTATKALSIAVSAVPAIAIGNVSVTLTASTGGAGFLSTKGSWTVTSSGNPLRITGISWFGFETNNRVLHGLWTRGYMSALDQNKAPDFSTLRIPFSNAMLKPGATTNSINFQVNPDLKDLTPLQVLDKIVGYCGQIGLRVIRGRHSAKADGYTGENVWFISGDAHFIEQRWIEDWVMLAKHYAGNSTVIGADLFNEPKRTAT
jgi:endoglucanase